MKQTNRQTQALARTQEVAAYNRKTRKLQSTGAAYTDKLVAARLQIRQTQEESR